MKDEGAQAADFALARRCTRARGALRAGRIVEEGARRHSSAGGARKRVVPWQAPTASYPHAAQEVETSKARGELVEFRRRRSVCASIDGRKSGRLLVRTRRSARRKRSSHDDDNRERRPRAHLGQSQRVQARGQLAFRDGDVVAEEPFGVGARRASRLQEGANVADDAEVRRSREAVERRRDAQAEVSHRITWRAPPFDQPECAV